ncbi:TPA: hypothetical protein DCQ22_03960 [Candidatus Nomurabacteria bacterium]|nr:hypothetical protein [Candidatus Nomurabacteria bacterium]
MLIQKKNLLKSRFLFSLAEITRVIMKHILKILIGENLMNEKLVELKNKAVSFITSDATKQTAKMIGEYVVIGVIGIGVTLACRAAGKAINEAILNNQEPPAIE